MSVICRERPFSGGCWEVIQRQPNTPERLLVIAPNEQEAREFAVEYRKLSQ